MEDPMRKNVRAVAATITVASYALLAAMAFVAGRALPAGPEAAIQLINPFELMERERFAGPRVRGLFDGLLRAGDC
jgi:hypothetical protein